MKKAMDRASGSGVFARDPDAQLDIIELEMTEEVQCHAAETKGTAWRLETSLREFPNIVPMEFWFEYPLHRVDRWEELKKLPAQGTFEAGKVKNKCHKTAEEAKEEFRNAFALQCINRKEVPMSDMMELLDIGESAIYNRVKKLGDEFKIENKIIKRLEPQENQGPEGTEEANSKPRKKAGTKARKTNARNPRKIKALGQKKRINNFIIPSWVYIYP